jgi:NAD(P)-dependent dehydrogenase (short-subunit alcohol dehydrogenase family)
MVICASMPPPEAFSGRHSTEIAVVGGGVIGLAIALRLAKAGHDVLVIEPNTPGSGASYGNASTIANYAVLPVGTPSVLRKLPALLFDRDSPLSIRVGALPGRAPWLLRFARASLPATVRRNAAGKPTFDLGAQEMEMGVGIHGEPGRRRIKMKSAKEIVAEMMEAIAAALKPKSGDPAILLVNGMGGTPLMELYLVYDAARRLCDDRGIKIARSLVGNYCTSLDMAGCSISLTKVDDQILKLWDAPVYTAALHW